MTANQMKTLFLVLYYHFHLFHNLFGKYVVHASEVTTHTGLVTIDAAWAAVKVVLYDILRILPPAHETGVGVGGPPDTHHGGGGELSQVHVGTVHADHHIEMAHQDEFFFQSVKGSGSIDTVEIAGSPFVEYFLFLFTAPEKEDATGGMATDKQADDSRHELWRIDFTFVGRKRGNAYPLLKLFLFTYYMSGKQPDVAASIWKYRLEIQLYRVAQTGQYVGIILK